MVRQTYQMIPSRDIDDQGIMESDWNRGTTGFAQPKVIVSHAKYPYTKKSKI